MPRPGPPVVLVVEDEALVRDYIATFLRDVGYSVLETDTAEHAIAIMDNGTRIDIGSFGAKLPTGKTFDTFDFNAVPMVSKAQVMALAAGDSWLDQGANERDAARCGGRPRSAISCSASAARKREAGQRSLSART